MKPEKFILIILLGVFIFLLPVFADAACNYHNVWGWAWSENIGWISFSCANTMSLGTGVDYGVDICTDNSAVDPAACSTKSLGDMVGYTWAGGGEDASGIPTSTIGWINFAPAGDIVAYPGCGYPISPCYSAKASTITGEVSGWARACAVFQVGCSGALKPDSERGGWDGWIKLGDSSQDYWIDSSDPNDRQVYIVNGTPYDEFHGWAWGSDVVGWISSNHENCDTDGDGDSDGAGACPSAGTPIPDYKVVFATPPVISSFGWDFPSPCTQSRIPNFSWDIDTTDPYDYEIQICSDAACGGGPLVPYPACATCLTESTDMTEWAPACSYCCDVAPYNNISFGGSIYYAQVRARYPGTGAAGWSSWQSVAFSTYDHCYPWADFDWAPKPPSIDQGVQFTDMSTCYDVDPDGDFCDPSASFLWEFPGSGGTDYSCIDPAINCGDAQNPKIEFLTIPVFPANEVKLEVTDSWGYGPCDNKYPITVTLPLPEYREVRPVSQLDNFLARIANIFARF